MGDSTEAGGSAKTKLHRCAIGNEGCYIFTYGQTHFMQFFIFTLYERHINGYKNIQVINIHETVTKSPYHLGIDLSDD